MFGANGNNIHTDILLLGTIALEHVIKKKSDGLVYFLKI